MKHYILAGAIALLTFASCKQADYPIEDAASYTKIFMPLANNGVNEKSMPITDAWTSFELGVGYGGIKENTSDIEIELAVEEDAVSVYNEQNGTSYTMAPEGSYRLTEDKVTIKAGSSGSNSIALEVNPVLLRGTKQYLVPVSIVNNSNSIAVTEGLKTTYFLVSGFYDNNPFEPIAKTNWEVIDFSSDASDGRAPLCIDGDLSTHWLSEWRRTNNVRPVHPHYVTIDMKDNQEIHGLEIYGRITKQGQSSQDYLFPVSIHIETSQDGTTWQSSGVFSLVMTPIGAPKGNIYFEQAFTCRYFKVTVLRSQNANSDTTGIAELVAF